MKQLDKLSIRWKQMVVILVSISTALLIVGGLMVAYDLSYFRKELTENLSKISGAIGNQIRYEDAESASQALSALGSEPNIVAANFYRLNGEDGSVNEPFAVYRREGAVIPPDISHTLGTLHEEQNEHLYYFYPVKHEGKWVGFLELRTNLRERSEKIVHYLATGAGAFLLALVFSMGLSMYLSRTITSPISELSKFVQKVGEEKDFSSRIEKKSNDEFGDLVEGLNKMLGKIQEQDTTLRNRNAEVEERIAQRTRELEENSRHQARAEKFLSSIVENLPITVFIKDAQDLHFVMWNRAGEDLTGYTNEELLGKGDYDFFPQEQAEKYVAADRAALKGGKLVVVEDEPLLTKSRGTRIARTLKVPICDDDGKPVYLLGISEDITERKKTEAELKKANHKLVEASRQAGMAEIATGILHNVGNVLNSVNVSVDLLEKKVRHSRLSGFFKAAELIEENKNDPVQFFSSNPKGPELLKFLINLSEYLQIERVTVLEELENLSRNVDHIKQIVVRQQTYAKVGGVSEEFSVVGLLEDTLRLCADDMEKLNIKINRDFSEVPKVSSDRHKILQILVNLIRNAKDAMAQNDEENRHLNIRVAQNEDLRILIEVTDNGIGLTSQALNRMFQMGFTTKKKGHGFGLHSAALAADELGGKLDVTSAGPNCGATFTLELPCLRQSQNSSSEENLVSEFASVA